MGDSEGQTVGKLDGRKILVTGAGAGIGRAIALLFASEGASLILAGRDKSKLDSVADAVSATVAPCDVRDLASVRGALLPAIEQLGGLDGVVNCAGLLMKKPFDEISADDWDALMSTNLTGPFNVVATTLPALRAAPTATIVNVASASGHLPMSGTSAYSASKAGVLMFTKGLACDLGPNIRANSVSPGVIKTEMTSYLWQNPQALQQAEARVALKKIGSPEEVARAVLFFSCADSAFTTGTDLPVDGGFTWR